MSVVRWTAALLAVDVPVFLDSRVAYALTPCSSRTGWRASSRQGIGADQAMTLFDADGNIVAQAGGPRLLLGQAADPALRAQLRQAQDALLDATDTNGTPSTWA
jgi:hypothetical protein